MNKRKRESNVDDPSGAAAEVISTVIGIDLGTANARAGVWRRRRGGWGTVHSLIPVDFVGSSSIKLGSEQNGGGGGGANPAGDDDDELSTVIYDMKLLLGRAFNDRIVQKMAADLPFSVVPDSDGQPVVQYQRNGRTEWISPTEVQAIILSNLRQLAERELAFSISKAVVTIPANFRQSPRRELLKAARLAGFKSVLLMHEPTAAAYAFVANRRQQNSHSQYNLLVFAMGAGTFDCAVLEVTGGKGLITLAIDGIEDLGGRNFDRAMLELVMEKAAKRRRGNGKMGAEKRERLLEKCREAKERLGAQREVSLDLGEFFGGAGGSQPAAGHIINVSRNEFHRKCEPMAQLAMAKVRAVINEGRVEFYSRRNGNGKKSFALHHILMVGGSARLQILLRMMRAEFGGLKRGQQQQHTAAEMHLADEQDVLRGAVMFGAHNSANTACSMPMGIQEVTPYCIGVPEFGDEFVKIVLRNSKFPLNRKRLFYRNFVIQTYNYGKNVYEGEEYFAKRNNCLGHLELHNLSPSDEGVVQIYVKMKLDKNGILTARVENKFDSGEFGELKQFKMTECSELGGQQQRHENEGPVGEGEEEEDWRTAQHRIQAMWDLIDEVRALGFQLKKQNGALGAAERRVRLYKLALVMEFDEWYEENRKTATSEQFGEKLGQFRERCAMEPSREFNEAEVERAELEGEMDYMDASEESSAEEDQRRQDDIHSKAGDLSPSPSSVTTKKFKNF